MDIKNYKWINYRGKRFDNNDWISGDLVCYAGQTYIHNKSVDKDEAVPVFVPVQPETVSRWSTFYTESDTKKAIYEGDILKCHFREGDITCVVEWFADKATFMVRRPKDTRPYAHLYLALNSEIIGNIWDNSDLVK